MFFVTGIVGCVLSYFLVVCEGNVHILLIKINELTIVRNFAIANHSKVWMLLAGTRTVSESWYLCCWVEKGVSHKFYIHVDVLKLKLYTFLAFFCITVFCERIINIVRIESVKEICNIAQWIMARALRCSELVFKVVCCVIAKTL